MHSSKFDNIYTAYNNLTLAIQAVELGLNLQMHTASTNNVGAVDKKSK